MYSQKSKTALGAMDSHKCPRCQAQLETQEHILTCNHVSAHKQCYNILPSIKKKMQPTTSCKAQQLFVKCFETWLENLETQILLDVSGVPDAQHELLQTAIEEQTQIGWTLAFCGYLSHHWAMVVWRTIVLWQRQCQSGLTLEICGLRRQSHNCGNLLTQCGTIKICSFMTQNSWMLQNEGNSSQCRDHANVQMHGGLHSRGSMAIHFPLNMRLKKPLDEGPSGTFHQYGLTRTTGNHDII